MFRLASRQDRDMNPLLESAVDYNVHMRNHIMRALQQIWVAFKSECVTWLIVLWAQ